MKPATLLLTCLLLSACAPNRNIEQSHSEDMATPTPAAATTPSAPVRVTVAELINRVLTAKPDAFLYPCDLNSQGESNRAKLRDIRTQWLAKEQDGRYLIAPDVGCVCPSICVLTVEDAQGSPPNNFGLLVLQGSPPEKLTWLAKGMDLSNTTLSWLNTTPQITFKNSDGSQAKICSVDVNQKLGRVTTTCSDSQGKKLPSL